MENPNGILAIIEVCLWLGIIIVCAVLIIYGILRWLEPSNDRSERLTTAGWIAFTVLTIMILYGRRWDIMRMFGNSDGSQAMTSITVNGTKMAVKLLLFGAIFVVTVIVLLVFAVLLCKGVAACLENRTVEKWASILKEHSNQFDIIIRTNIFTCFVTCGVLLVFILLPLLLGSPKDGSGMVGTWLDGLQRFCNVLKTSSNDESVSTTSTASIPATILTYVLVYVIVLGVGFSIARIIHTIVKDYFEQRQTTNLIDEYSGSMGVLGVGVSILLVVQDVDFNFSNYKLPDILKSFFKYFAIVAFVVTLAIIILEVIRLAMDMRETLIRKEAKHLFVALVGHAALLVLILFNSIFSALRNIISPYYEDEKDIDNIQHKLTRRIVETMGYEANQEAKNEDITFIIFKETITKK